MPSQCRWYQLLGKAVGGGGAAAASKEKAVPAREDGVASSTANAVMKSTGDADDEKPPKSEAATAAAAAAAGSKASAAPRPTLRNVLALLRSDSDDFTQTSFATTRTRMSVKNNSQEQQKDVAETESEAEAAESSTSKKPAAAPANQTSDEGKKPEAKAAVGHERTKKQGRQRNEKEQKPTQAVIVAPDESGKVSGVARAPVLPGSKKRPTAATDQTNDEALKAAARAAAGYEPTAVTPFTNQQYDAGVDFNNVNDGEKTVPGQPDRKKRTVASTNQETNDALKAAARAAAGYSQPAKVDARKAAARAAAGYVTPDTNHQSDTCDDSTKNANGESAQPNNEVQEMVRPKKWDYAQGPLDDEMQEMIRKEAERAKAYRIGEELAKVTRMSTDPITNSTFKDEMKHVHGNATAPVPLDDDMQEMVRKEAERAISLMFRQSLCNQTTISTAKAVLKQDKKATSALEKEVDRVKAAHEAGWLLPAPEMAVAATNPQADDSSDATFGAAESCNSGSTNSVARLAMPPAIPNKSRLDEKNKGVTYEHRSTRMSSKSLQERVDDVATIAKSRKKPAADEAKTAATRAISSKNPAAASNRISDDALKAAARAAAGYKLYVPTEKKRQQQEEKQHLNNGAGVAPIPVSQSLKPPALDALPQQYTVCLEKPMGINLIPWDAGNKRGARVYSKDPDSVAEKIDEIRKGDVVVAVDEDKVYDKTHGEVIKLILSKDSKVDVKLTFARVPGAISRRGPDHIRTFLRDICRAKKSNYSARPKAKSKQVLEEKSPKRRRGRPRKASKPTAVSRTFEARSEVHAVQKELPKRRRGKSSKSYKSGVTSKKEPKQVEDEESPKRRRGRSRKVAALDVTSAAESSKNKEKQDEDRASTRRRRATLGRSAASIKDPDAPLLNRRTPILPDDKWVTVWSKLENSGWTQKKGSGLIDYYYILPGRSINDKKGGIAFLTSEEAMQQYCELNYGWRGNGYGRKKRRSAPKTYGIKADLVQYNDEDSTKDPLEQQQQAKERPSKKICVRPHTQKNGTDAVSDHSEPKSTSADVEQPPKRKRGRHPRQNSVNNTDTVSDPSNTCEMPEEEQPPKKTCVRTLKQKKRADALSDNSEPEAIVAADEKPLKTTRAKIQKQKNGADAVADDEKPPRRKRGRQRHPKQQPANGAGSVSDQSKPKSTSAAERFLPPKRECVGRPIRKSIAALYPTEVEGTEQDQEDTSDMPDLGGPCEVNGTAHKRRGRPPASGTKKRKRPDWAKKQSKRQQLEPASVPTESDEEDVHEEDEIDRAKRERDMALVDVQCYQIQVRALWSELEEKRDLIAARTRALQQSRQEAESAKEKAEAKDEILRTIQRVLPNEKDVVPGKRAQIQAIRDLLEDKST